MGNYLSAEFAQTYVQGYYFKLTENSNSFTSVCGVCTLEDKAVDSSWVKPVK